MKRLALIIALTSSPALADCDALKGLVARDAAKAATVFAPMPATCQSARQTTGQALFCYAEHMIYKGVSR